MKNLMSEVRPQHKRDVGRAPGSGRRIALAALIGALFSFAEPVLAGNVQFSGTTPAVVDTEALAAGQAAVPDSAIRRGHEKRLLRATQSQPDEVFTPQPNNVRVMMPPVTEELATAHDQKMAREMPAGINLNGAIETLPKLEAKRTAEPLDSVHLQNFAQPAQGMLKGSGVSGANNIVTNGPAVGPASIAELARALRYHPDLIYQYVRNNIEIDPVRGIHKGALGAILDNQGSAFDQAQLMVSLLRTSGYDARFVRGVIKLSAQQFTDWYGVPSSNVCAVLNLMGQTQVPVYSISAAQGGSCPGLNAAMTEISLEHVWVKANIGGTWYTFDPAYKPHTLNSAIDLKTAAGYDPASFISTAKSGAYIDNTLVRGLNRNGVRSSLQTYATNLANWIRKNKPTATLSDIVGGKAIIPFLGGTVRQTQNPLQDTRWGTDEWTDIAADFKPTLRVIYQGIDQTFTSDAIYGKRLTITYNTSNQPLLKLDGVQVGAAGTAVAPGADSVVTLVVWHNAYNDLGSDHSFDQHIKGGGTYLISNGWGPTGRGLSQSYLKYLENTRAAGNADTSEPVLGASLGVLAAQWISQSSQTTSITDHLANTYSVEQHQVGISGYDGNGPYVDLPSVFGATVSLSGNAASDKAAFESIGMHRSILESAAVNQTSGTSAVSTTKLLDQAISQGLDIFTADPGNWKSSVRAKLPANCQSELAVLDSYINQNYQVLIPNSCQLAENKWKGTGYFVVGQGTMQMLGAIISGGFSGGFYTTSIPASIFNTAAINNSQSPQIMNNFNGINAGDPIDMVHGNFLYEHEDIKTGYGDAPDSLHFQRLYSSGMKNQTGPLGKGWTHNYNMQIRSGSDGFLAMGNRQALDAVATIVEHKASYDLLLNYTTSPTAAKYLMAVMAQRWWGDQLVDNTRVVTFGLNSDVFVRQPDGTFKAPPGKAVSLAIAGDTGTYTTLTGAYYTFDLGTGKATRYTQPDGKSLKFTWNGDLLTKVDNAVGRSLTLTYSNNRLQTVASPQQTVRYAYDGNDNLVSETDPDSYATRFEYDQPGRMTRFYQPAFPSTPVVSNVYDTLDRVQTQTSAAGNRFDYYFSGYRSEEVTPGGSSRTFYIDGESNLIQIGDPVGNWTLKDYDGQNRLVRETRPEGGRIEYAYDDATCATKTSYARDCTHNVLSVMHYPRPGTSDPTLTQRFTYDATNGKVATATDPKGQVTTTTYTGQGLVNTVTRPAVNGTSSTTTYTYESVAPIGIFFWNLTRPVRIAEKIDSTRSTSTTISYSSDFTPSTLTQDADSLAVKTVTTFDSEGRLVTSKRDGVAQVTNAYDKRGNVTRTNANLLSGDEVIGYDADSRETSRGVAITGGAMVTCRRYNAMGDVVRVWGPAKTTGVSVCPAESAPVPITDTAYDNHHRPTRVTQYMAAADGGNRVTDTVYYDDDSVKSVRKAVGTGLEQSYVSYVYNPDGTVALTTDARGNTTVNLYDGHDRLYRTHYPLQGQPGMGDASNYEQYTWDANGNLTALRKRDGQTVTQGFDALDRLTTRTFPGGVGNVQYSYDLRGLKTASQFTDGTHTITNSYDGLGQLTQTSAAGRTLRYTRDAAGNVTDIAWPDSFHVATTYDTYRRPTQILENGTASLAKYSYDTLNRRTQVDLGNGTRTELAYDAQGGLSTLNHRFTSSTEDWVATFSRNQLGGITQATVSNSRYAWAPTAASVAYSTNVLNQYTAASGKGVSYDLNGNLTGDGTWTYGYDLDNRMKTASGAGTTAALAYDPEGRLVKTTVNGTDAVLMYDGQNLAAEYNSAGTLTRRYVFGPGVDAPLVQYEGAGTTSKNWLYANQQGSVVALANASGATTGSQGYGPFGETGGTPASRFGYTGQQYLAPLGLYYYKARMYSPAMGRFLQTDPVGYKDDVNWYAYVGNNPANFSDPTGMIAASGFASTGSAAVQVAVSVPKLDAPTFSMPVTAAGNQSVIQVAKTPNVGEPGTWYTNPGSGQMRLYGDLGAPVVDLDFDHKHLGLQPHAHNWNGGVRDGGTDVVPFSPWKP
jgi:RHS repeat-associated protein